jgi:hypothetical protein
MKVLSLIQPWASLIAFSEKKIETRSWATKYRGPLLIHASANFPRDCKEICMQRPFGNVLSLHGFTPIRNGKIQIRNSENKELPVGMIIAKCNLVDCKKIVSEESYHDIACLEGGPDVFGNEYFFGDYTPGRYAWILEDIEILEHPIPAKGKLGLWNYELAATVKE